MRQMGSSLIILMGISLATFAEAGWLEDLSKQAQQNLDRQVQRAAGTQSSGPQRQPTPAWPGAGSNRGEWPAFPNQGSGGVLRQRDWKVFCRTKGLTSDTRNNGSIHTGQHQPATNGYLLLESGFPSDSAARNWISQRCPSWRCDWNGRCVAQGTPTDIDRAGAVSRPGSGGAGRRADWKVFCRTDGLTSNTRNNGRIHTGQKQPPTGRYILLKSGFSSDAAARGWINQTCPSWRCDWNGQCVSAQTPYSIDQTPRRVIPDPEDALGGGLFGQ